MPIATPEVYAEMIARAKEHSFAFPAINCTSSETINAAIKGFADAGSDGIIQFSTGGAEFGSGLGVKDMVTGAVALAEFAHVIAEKYDVTIALHTDHCPKDKLDGFVRPLIAISKERVDAGKNPLFQSRMWDGSAIPLDENLEIDQQLLAAPAELLRARQHCLLVRGALPLRVRLLAGLSRRVGVFVPLQGEVPRPDLQRVRVPLAQRAHVVHGPVAVGTLKLAPNVEDGGDGARAVGGSGVVHDPSLSALRRSPTRRCP